MDSGLISRCEQSLSWYAKSLSKRMVVAYDPYMEKQALGDESVEPTEDVLKRVMGEGYQGYRWFASMLKHKEVELSWRWYRDTRSWLGKATSAKQTICWISAWEGAFRVTFYFPERLREPLFARNVSDRVRKCMQNAPPGRKSIAVAVTVESEQEARELEELVNYQLIRR